jgi:hypothetical protein
MQTGARYANRKVCIIRMVQLFEVMRMVKAIPDDQWAAIDAFIVANKKIEAVKAIKEKAECGLPEALIVFYERYAKLRAETPERFDCSNREYWSTFYTDGPPPPMAEPGTLPEVFDL